MPRRDRGSPRALRANAANLTFSGVDMRMGGNQ
jgi:hypothetical protein